MSNRSEESTPLLSVPSDTEEIKRFIETLEEPLNKHEKVRADYSRYE